MAKKQGSRSQAIRDHLADHPDDGPTAVCKALAAKGIKVTATHVSNVARNLREGKTSGKRGRPAGSINATAITSSGAVGLDLLMAAKAFINKAGGVDKAVALLKSLSQLFA